MMPAGLRCGETFAELAIASVIHAPFVSSVLWADDALARVIRPVALTDRIAENPAKRPIVRAAVPFPPVTMARPLNFVLTSAADFPAMTSRWNFPASMAVKSLTVRFPIRGMMCR